MNTKKKKEIFKNFMIESDILIVDKSSASKNRLGKALVDFGANLEKVHQATSYQEARELYESKKPKLVICDYYIVGGSGFDLFKDIKKEFKDHKDIVFILITSNLSQAAVAKAAEEDVDSFILKPYTVNILGENLMETIVDKQYPNEYVSKIEEGKEALEAGDHEKAMSIFKDALVMNDKPSLAHYYNGYSNAQTNQNDVAVSEYNQGLEHNHIHFKCLNGLYELHMGQKNVTEAYSIAKNLVKYFPANNQRLAQTIRLAIATKNYDDLNFLYDVFVASEEKNPQLVNYICAGMYVVGKHFIMEDSKFQGIEMFKKVGVTFGNHFKFLKAIIETLVEYDMEEHAIEFLHRFPEEMKEDDFYIVCDFLINSTTMDREQFIDKAHDMISEGKKSFVIYKQLIKALFNNGSESRAISYINEAKKEWPEKSGDLKELEDRFTGNSAPSESAA
jgi:CheY-like chemotaxis protein